MKESPLFSVLIANYNNGAFICDAIESVKSQSYSNWEIVIVDDASSDNSKELYKELELNGQIHVYYNLSNRGCGYTKRRCVELANGDLCGFLDPDDTLMPDALEVMANAHSCNSDVSLIYSRYNIISADGTIVSVSNQQEHIPEGESFLQGRGGISHFVSFKRTFYLKTPGIDPDYKRAVDHDLYFLLEEVGRVLFIDEVLYNYRVGTGENLSLGHNEDKAYLWHLVGMIDACRRRGKPIEDIMFKDFNSFITWNRIDARNQGIESTKRTISYRVGNKLIKPLRSLSHFYSNMKQKLTK